MGIESNFRYNRRGPWPQPNPTHPVREAPAVLHLPFSMQFDWFLHIGLRYIWNIISFSIPAFIYALFHPNAVESSDEEFSRRFDIDAYSKFLNPTLDPPDKKTFAKFLKKPKPGTKFFKVDFSVIDRMTPLPGIYAAATVTLFKQEKGRPLEAVAISLGNYVVTPENGDTWRLAKFYVIQAAATTIIFSAHALLHFPVDSLNAISVTTFPKDHVLFKLLDPHMRFTLPLDNAVLETNTSPLENKQIFLQNAGPAPGQSLRQLVAALNSGVQYPNGKWNSSYPPYDYLDPKAREGVTVYSAFNKAYFETIHNFVKKVVKLVPKDDKFVSRWADHVSANVPGFPDAKGIQKPGMLALALALYIWDVSVGHAVDHYNQGTLNLNENPMRVRIEPPGSPDAIQNFDVNKVMTFFDVWRYRLFWKMFITPTNVTLLHNVNYKFEQSELIEANNEFLQDLRQTEASLASQGIPNIIPLKKISRTIQY
ncbi:MAG: hypothetical protein NXI24_23665 [bacterium]|nr:hypothetical protein [bacterium]